MTKKIEIETFGFKDFEARKKSFVGRAKRLAEEAERARIKAELVAGYPERLEELREMAEVATRDLLAQGKVRLDGKTGNALDTRGLRDTCGLVMAPTRLYSSNDDLFLEKVYWADEWVLELVENMKKITSTTERKKFYDRIAKLKDDPEAIQAEAGLIALQKHSD